jgi:hypothetical protein
MSDAGEVSEVDTGAARAGSSGVKSTDGVRNGSSGARTLAGVRSRLSSLDGRKGSSVEYNERLDEGVKTGRDNGAGVVGTGMGLPSRLGGIGLAGEASTGEASAGSGRRSAASASRGAAFSRSEQSTTGLVLLVSALVSMCDQWRAAMETHRCECTAGSCGREGVPKRRPQSTRARPR